MTITSKGYTGSVNNVDWAVLADKLGAQFAVFGADAFRVAAATGDRAVSVRSGEATGQGIRDISDNLVTLTGAPVASGNRWDLVALRRNWGTSTTTLVMIQGGATKNLPASRRTNVGDVVDHPLALVRFTAGQTAAQEIEDLRVWHGDGGILARSLLVREFLDRIGTRVRIKGVDWLRSLNVMGMAEWGTDSTSTFRFVRTVPSDSSVSSGSDIGLAEGSAEAPPGVYLVTARASLYATGEPVIGRVYAEARSGGTVQREEARWDIVAEGSYAKTPTVTLIFQHPGGDLSLTAGYRRVSGTFWVTGQSSGETVVTATLIGSL